MSAVVTVMGKVPLFLMFLRILVSGSHPVKREEVYVRAGEMVALHCPYSHEEAQPTWTSYGPLETDLSNMSSEERSQTGILIYRRSLVILSATLKFQGYYSCSLRNTSVQSWFRLTVYTTQSSDVEWKTQYPMTCYSQESCTLTCPDRNIPDKNTPNITSAGIVWQKMSESVSQELYHFSSVDEKERGAYTCTRSYLYRGQTYIKTFTVILNVKPGERWKRAEILSPKEKDVFYVDLGSTLMINCTATLSSEFDEVFWLSGNSLVDQNHNSSVFWTEDINDEGTKMTASLIFKNVSEKDLSKHYTCKLESVSKPASLVTITLAPKDPTSSLIVALSVGAMILVVALTALFYVRCKTDTAIFLRNALGCYSSISAVKEAGSDCIEQSHTVVLVPTSSDPGPGSGLLTDDGMEQRSDVISIRTETHGPKRSQSLKGLEKS